MADDAISVLESQAQEIEQRIQPAKDAIRDDEERLRRLRTAIAVLEGRSAPAPRVTVRTTSSSQIDEATVVEFVRDNQPATGAQIGQRVGASGNALSTKLRQMQDAGLLRAEGTGRAKRYSVA
jgi:predicted HTH transcriptional regulator